MARHRRAWLLALCACGHPSGAVPDGAPAPDASIDSAAELPTRIVAYTPDGLAPLGNAVVHFIAPDLSDQKVMTDAQGIAEAVTPPDSTVVVLQRDEGGVRVLAKVFAGTTPGETIIAGKRRDQAFPQLADITFAPPAFPTAKGYQIAVSCSHQAMASTPSLVVHPQGCPDAATAIAVAWATDATGARISGPSVLANLDLAAAAGTTVPMPAYDGTAIATIASTITNVPAGATAATWAEQFFTGIDVQTGADAAALPATQLHLLDVGDRTLSSVSYRMPGFGPIRADRVDTGRIAAFAFDASAMIRGVRGAKFDPMTSAVVWEEDPTGQAPQLVDVELLTSNAVRELRISIHARYPPARAIPLPPLPASIALQPGDSAVVTSFRMQTIVGATFDEMLTTVDTNFNFTPIFWDPAFVGTVLEASDR